MSTKWKKLITREGVDIMTVSGLDIAFYSCIRAFNKTIREPFFTWFENRTLTHYICVNALAVGRKIYPQFFKTPEMVRAYYKEGTRFLVRVEKIVKRYKTAAKGENTQWQLLAFQEFRKEFLYVNQRFSIYPWWGIESWQIDADQVINAMIVRNHAADLRERILASLYRPWKKTAIIRLQEYLQNGVAIAKLVKEFQFLRSWSAVWYREIDRDWILNFKQKGVNGADQKFLSNKKINALLKPNHKEKWFLDIAPYIIFFKDWRDDVRRQHVYQWSFLFDAIASRFGVERNDLGYCSLDELDAALRTGQLSLAIIKYRRENPCIITANKSDSVMRAIDKKIKRYQKIVTDSKKVNRKEIVVRGTVACAGIVTGVVRIIRTYHDIKKFAVGEILVANTTHPNYVPAMQKAVAIVTNEGGIVSHAAIVARELKKPCIVGTKTATNVFKDGDAVEVDANQGVVKKL